MFSRGILLKTLVPLFILLLMGFYLFWNTVPNKLSRELSKDLQTSVFVGDATFSLKKIGLKKIVINSPKKSRLPQAFSCDQLNIRAWVTNYLKKDIEIDLIELDDVYLGLEFDSPSSANGNWTRLMENLQKATQESSSKSKKTVLIKKLIIRNIKCQVVYLNKKDGVINLKTIDQLEFDNISSDEGFPLEQLSNSVLGKMLKEVFVKQNLKDMIDKWVQPQQQLDKLIKPFKLF